MNPPPYPFSAIVGHDRLRLALLLCAVRPEIGGVLIRGEKGTAKSTAVRALAAVLAQADPDARLVELPIGATEDRVVGSLDLQKVLRDGRHAFSPGLLARAHGGVLYVDEVNLLPDHLVDVLLDAAAMGRVHIERDGVSHSHEARFVLIGTMNPEEGELRPQLLDRFGLAVDVHASRDVGVRTAVIRARLAYEADPAGFAAGHAASDSELARRVAAARALVAGVRLPDGELNRIAALCAAFDVDGMRADLVVARTAIAHAAWRAAGTGASEATGEITGASEATGEITVGEGDIRVAVELALPHRRRRDPFDDPGIDPAQLDDAMSNAAANAAAEMAGTDEEPDPPGGGGESLECPAEPPARQGNSTAARPASPPSATFRTRALTVPGVGDGHAGRRSAARNSSGAVVRAAATAEPGHGVHLFATVLAAAERHRLPGPLRPETADIRRAVRVGREGNLVIFVVDASGSMAARDRMAAVSGAALSLLRDAYQRRDKVAVVTFRAQGARLVLPPTASSYLAAQRLTRLDTGGTTPLAEGLLAARDIVVRERARDRARRPLLVVLTDGRATAGPDPLQRSRIAAQRLAAEGAAAVVVDCETSYVRLGLANDLAGQLRAPVLRLEHLRADCLAQAVRRAA